MTRSAIILFAAALFLAASPLRSEVSASKIESQIEKLRSLPDDKRPAATVQLAHDVMALPAGKPKLRLADALSHLVTEGDQGADALQAVADTLAKSLAETPVPVKGDEPPMPYMESGAAGPLRARQRHSQRSSLCQGGQHPGRQRC